MTSREPADAKQIGWLIAAGIVVAVALWARVFSIRALPAMTDFDAPGHVLNTFSLLEGRLAPPSSWLGFHPPLYHAIGALGWAVLPTSLRVDVWLRLLSLAAGMATLAVAFAALRKRTTTADAAVVCALAAGVPVFAIATTMLGNETLCALFVTILLASLLGRSESGASQKLSHAISLGVVGGLAALAKSTGWLAVGIAGLTVAWQQRAQPRRMVAALALIGGLPLLLAGPFYARIVAAAGGSPFALVSSAALSPDLALMMSRQPPGERHLRDYVSVPAATFLAPRFDQPGMTESVPGLLYASTWADGHGHLVWLNDNALRVAPFLTIAGLVPSTLFAIGALSIFRRRRPGELACLGFAAILLVSLLRYSWVLPHYSPLKASYLLAALLPALLALVRGLETVPRRLLPTVRASLLALSLLGTFFTTYGWWWWLPVAAEENVPAAATPESSPTLPAVR